MGAAGSPGTACPGADGGGGGGDEKLAANTGTASALEAGQEQQQQQQPQQQQRHGRRVLLDASQRDALETALSQLGASPWSSVASEGCEAGDAGDAGKAPGGWYSFYDNAAAALTSRGWWLCQSGGSWSLRVPAFEFLGESVVKQSGFKEFTDQIEILEQVGLTSHAELMRKGVAKNMDRLLDQAGVVVFARLHAESPKAFSLRQKDDGSFEGGEAGGEGSSPPQLLLKLSRLRFDPKHGEDAAVAELLFSQGAAARVAMQAMVADFEWNAGSSKSSAISEAEIAAKLLTLGFDFAVSGKAARPEAVAFLRRLRPVHLQTLHRAGVDLEDSEE